MIGQPVAAACGLVIDRLAGEPPAAVHPVASFGSVMQHAEHVTYRDGRAAGVAHLGIGITIAGATALILRRLLGRRLATAVAVAVCSAGRMLDDEAATIAAAVQHGDLDAARRRLPALVGRDPSQLDEAGIARAVIESLAENGVDAVVASWWWGSVAGAPGALIHRAVNTLDAMVGHRNDRYRNFGWASARFDDLLNYLPARLAAAAVATVRPRRAGAIWRAVRTDAPAHPSPNGGVIEAAYAAALGVRLGGANRYGDVVEHRGTLGDGPPAAAADVGRAVQLRRHSLLALAVGGVLVRAKRRRLHRRR